MIDQESPFVGYNGEVTLVGTQTRANPDKLSGLKPAFRGEGRAHQEWGSKHSLFVTRSYGICGGRVGVVDGTLVRMNRTLIDWLEANLAR